MGRMSYWCIGVGLVLLAIKPSCGVYHHIGCFNDRYVRALPDDLGSISTVQQCYDQAAGNYPVFGTENGNECWSGSDLQTYDKYGETNTCKNGLGGRWSLDVYVISVCNIPSPLGMESFEIPDSAISASSMYTINHAAWYARLRMTARDGHTGGWSARYNNKTQWLQIDLGSTIEVKKIGTQGRHDAAQWVKSFQLSHSTDGTSFASYVHSKVFQANSDQNSVVLNTIQPPIVARYIRILPKSWNSHLSMRVELFGLRNACGDKTVGLASGAIRDEAISASSTDSRSTPASNGRLNYTAGSSWCASSRDSTPYLQADLGSVYIICAVTTQGNSRADQWVKTYQVQYSVDNVTWSIYKEQNRIKVFHSNFDRSSLVYHLLFEGIICQYFRLLPKLYYGAACLRMEIFGTKRSTECDKRALWIEDKKKFIDKRFTASSSYNDVYRPYHARLRLNKGWCWATAYAKTGDYLQIDLGGGYFICGVATKGTRKNRKEWVTKYNLLVSEKNAVGSWMATANISGSQEFPGNKDRDTLKKNLLLTPASAKFVQFHVTDFYGHPDLRVEVYGVMQGCRKSLGLECRAFKKLGITASSGLRVVDRARLYNYGAWCAGRQSSEEYIQVDLGGFKVVTGLATQGNSKPERSDWVTTYIVRHSLDSIKWIDYKEGKTMKVLQGNKDRSSVQANWFNQPFAARYIRVFPLTWNNELCLRIDLYGCTNVLSPKVLSLQNKTLIATSGSFVDLECNARGQPLPQVTWTLNSSEVTNMSHVTIDPRGWVKSKLTVHFDSIAAVLSNYSCNRLDNATRSVNCQSEVYTCTAKYDNVPLAVPDWMTAIVTVTLYVPAAPPVRIDNIQSRFISLRWTLHSLGDGESDITHYLVRHHHLLSNVYNETVIKTPRPIDKLEIVHLHPYSNYSLRIRGVSIVGVGIWSETKYFRTASEVPGTAPKNVRTFAVSSRTIQVFWKEPEKVFGPVLGYRIIYSSAISTEQVKIINGRSTNCTLDMLEEWTIYRVQILVFNDKGNGPPSNVVTAQTFEDEPNKAPTEIMIIVSDLTNFNVSWSPLPLDQSNGIVHRYEVMIECKNKSDAKCVRVKHKTTKTYCVLINLKLCTEYRIYIRACTSIGCGPYSDPVAKVTAEPEAPSNVTVVAVDKRKMKLKWNAPKIHGKKILFYTINYTGRKSYKASFEESGQVNVTGSTSTATVSNLTPSTDYQVRVSATTECGSGTFSDTVSFSTKLDKPMALTGSKMQMVNFTENAVQVNLWPTNDANGPISAYQVIVLQTANSQKNLPVDYETKLADYRSSVEKGVAFYITAELDPSFLNSRKLFLVGDGKIYNTYENVRLKSASYNVYQRSVSRVSKQELFSIASQIASVVHLKDSATDKKVDDKQAGSVGLTAGVVVSVVVAAAALIFGLVFWKKRRKSHDKTQNDSTEMSIVPKMTSRFAQSTQQLIIDGIESDTATYVNVSTSKGLYNQIDTEDEGNGNEDTREYLNHQRTSSSNLKQPHKEDSAVPLNNQEPVDECDYSVTYDGEALPIPKIQFSEYYRQAKKHKYLRLKDQFKKLPENQQNPWTVAKLSTNKVKNRYANIIAYDHSRVVLHPAKGTDSSDYINACYIKGFDGTQNKYIATQGPSPATCNDFWRMVWQENVSCIVMITNLIEKGKTKCHQYWPDQNKKYGNIYVTNHKVDMFADLVHRTFFLTKAGEDDNRHVSQFHFTVWPDHGVPQHATAILGLRRRVRTQCLRTSGPLLVHCSAGVGRTGTFIVIDAMLERMKREGNVDIFNYTKAIRDDRISMIQTGEQFTFVHTAIFEALTCGNTEVPAHDLTSVLKKLSVMNTKEEMTGYELEFTRLNLISGEISQKQGDVGEMEENREKNRNPHIIPVDSARVFLRGKSSRSDYINASFADASKRRNAFILTQAPLSNTVADFWQMIFEHRIGTIVMLNNLQETNQTYPIYWPSTQKQTHGPFTIDIVSREECEDYIITKLKIVSQTGRLSQKGKHTHVVQHFRHIRWPDKGVPTSCQALLDLVSLVEKSQQRCGDAPIVVQCSDGVGRSGTFVAVYSILERLKLEQVVDVFQSIKVIRVKRPLAVETLSQYVLCYEAARAYLDSFSEYANFGDF